MQAIGNYIDNNLKSADNNLQMCLNTDEASKKKCADYLISGVAGGEGEIADGIKAGEKILKQMVKRGWSKSDILETIKNPAKTVATRDTRWIGDGLGNDDSATAYIREDGHYVVKNDITDDIVQISNRNKSDWKSPF